MKNWLLKRRIKKKLKGVNFEFIENDNSEFGRFYRTGGEYQALLWLLAYVENRAAATPEELIESTLWKIIRRSTYSKIGYSDYNPREDAAYIMTLMRYIK